MLLILVIALTFKFCGYIHKSTVPTTRVRQCLVLFSFINIISINYTGKAPTPAFSTLALPCLLPTSIPPHAPKHTSPLPIHSHLFPLPVCSSLASHTIAPCCGIAMTGLDALQACCVAVKRMNEMRHFGAMGGMDDHSIT